MWSEMSEGTVDSAAGRSVRFVLFGGVRIVRNGVRVEVAQPKQRGLLGLLMATADEPVSMALVIDTLWPGEPAASVTNQIHRHVGALRRLCEPNLQRRSVGRYILPAGDGYRLAVDESESDVLQFRVVVREAHRRAEGGHRHEAPGRYRAALPSVQVYVSSNRAIALAGDARELLVPGDDTRGEVVIERIEDRLASLADSADADTAGRLDSQLRHA